ncbi:radical SAM protein [Agaribacter flavus]|uniref:Radical SAM protein n=1 Tax=Agaribacter flavus TaxID=1902781 RepID=A0ABV7FIZ4_9ALTE
MLTKLSSLSKENHIACKTLQDDTTRSSRWKYTPSGEKAGFIQPHGLKELWFHTGTKCNLSCDFCLEGSSPQDKRLASPKFEEVKPYIDEALELGVEHFSFTGGEPLLVKDIIDILSYAAQHRPCLVLTNGTDPLIKRLEKLKILRNAKHPVSFRISLDSADEKTHDMGRGQGEFKKALIGLRRLHNLGFKVSVARHIAKDENIDQVNAAFEALFSLNGLPSSLNIVAFPDFLTPGALPEVPHITENCMTSYQTQEQRKHYMCASSKMIVKKDNRMQIYACTLVDDDEEYSFGSDLRASLQQRVSMKHHRCYSCFAHGASCSEM